MVKRNPHFAKLQSGYLFPEINKRKQAYLKMHPEAKILNLGIGDTTLPLDPHIAQRLQKHSFEMSTIEGYLGYGPEQGQSELRQKIASVLYSGRVHSEEVFVSDGAKCDIGRLQLLFGPDATMAVQDPAYPVYVDTSIMVGQPEIMYMPCNPENNFFPDLEQIKRTDLIYFCSPNNPTGAISTHEQLEKLIAFAKKNRSILIFDSAYSAYISDPSLPKSIYEIPGAREVAIEVGSFSKMAGFTGLRLGWVVIPEELRFEDQTSVRKDWERIHTTFFNGASCIVQKAGLAVLENEGLQFIQRMIESYMSNAEYLAENLRQLGITTYGGDNAPYIWVYFGKSSSWELFDTLLTKAQIIATPGIGFGSEGEGFLRFSAFAQRSHIEEAVQRLKELPLEVATA